MIISCFCWCIQNFHRWKNQIISVLVNFHWILLESKSIGLLKCTVWNFESLADRCLFWNLTTQFYQLIPTPICRATSVKFGIIFNIVQADGERVGWRPHQWRIEVILINLSTDVRCCKNLISIWSVHATGSLNFMSKCNLWIFVAF